jgi:hypothetical protein
MTHFNELSTVPGVGICRSPDDMLGDLDAVLGWAARPETAAETREAARYFVANGTGGYARTVLDLLAGIVPDIAARPSGQAARPKQLADQAGAM